MEKLKQREELQNEKKKVDYIEFLAFFHFMLLVN
jgi:hypothetical protein